MKSPHQNHKKSGFFNKTFKLHDDTFKFQKDFIVHTKTTQHSPNKEFDQEKFKSFCIEPKINNEFDYFESDESVNESDLNSDFSCQSHSPKKWDSSRSSISVSDDDKTYLKDILTSEFDLLSRADKFSKNSVSQKFISRNRRVKLPKGSQRMTYIGTGNRYLVLQRNVDCWNNEKKKTRTFSFLPRLKQSKDSGISIQKQKKIKLKGSNEKFIEKLHNEMNKKLESRRLVIEKFVKRHQNKKENLLK